MNLRQIQLFAAVVETGGFTAAAKREGTVQPAVSAAIRRLETEVGAPLLIRGERPLALTEAGAAFLRHAHSILYSVQASKDEIRVLAAGEAGCVTLASPPMLAGYVLPPLLKAFTAEYPGVQLRVAQSGAEEVREAVLRGEADLGLTAEGQAARGLEFRLLQRRKMVAWLARGSPKASSRVLAWEQLLDLPLILFPRSFYQRMRLEQAAELLGRGTTPLLETDAIPLMAEAVRSGLGAATLLDAVPPPEGVVAIALPDDAVVPVSICRRRNVAMGAAAQRLYDHLVSKLSGPSLPA